MVVSLVVGKRTAEAVSEVVRDFRRRTGSRVMRLITSDEYPAYPDAIRAAYGTTVVPPRTGRPGRPREPYLVMPPEVTYATVHKHRENGRVVRVSTRIIDRVYLINHGITTKEDNHQSGCHKLLECF